MLYADCKKYLSSVILILVPLNPKPDLNPKTTSELPWPGDDIHHKKYAKMVEWGSSLLGYWE